MKRRLEPSESAIQRSFIEWVRASEARFPALKLSFAVPNGSYRHIATAVRAKREGQRAGVPDFIIPVPRAPRAGLAIEFKKPGGRATRDQKNWMSLARQYGWRCEICYSAEDAIKLVKEYLS